MMRGLDPRVLQSVPLSKQDTPAQLVHVARRWEN